MKSFYDKDTRRLSTGQLFFCLIYQRISIVSLRLKMLLSKLYSEIFRTPWEIIDRNLGCTPAEKAKMQIRTGLKVYGNFSVSSVSSDREKTWFQKDGDVG